MNLRLFPLFPLAFASTAVAGPIEFTHQGRLLDGSGAPINGATTVELSLWTHPTSTASGDQLWSRAFPVTLQDGHYAVTLGTDDTGRLLDNDYFLGSDVWLETRVGTTALGPRTRLTSVPMAAAAHTASHVRVEGPAVGSTCTDDGAIVFDTDAGGLRVCAGGSWTIAGGAASGLPVFGSQAGDGLAAGTAGASCANIKFDFPSSTTRMYYIDPFDTGSPYPVWCEMETAGGGWTLVAKLTGNSGTMNRLNTAQWRSRTYIGSIASLTNENALGRTYEDIPFTDVLIQNLDNPERHLAWRHPTMYVDMHSIVDAGQRISDGVRLAGSVTNLSYSLYPDDTYHDPCPGLKYGFLGYDQASAQAASFVGHSIWTGHAGGVVGASMYQNGGISGCLSDFGFGGGYGPTTSGTQVYNINAHHWNDSNTYTAGFHAHALYVRHVVGPTDDGLGTGLSATSPAASCKALDTNFGYTTSQAYWLKPPGGGQPYRAWCDMVTDGGGWTLVAKLNGNTPFMNKLNTAQWRDRNYVGSIADLDAENAIGPSYEHVAFTDVLLKSLPNPLRQLAWRHPASIPSVFSIVDSGTRVSNGSVILGSFTNLDYTSYPTTTYHTPCAGIKYGFLGYDQASRQAATLVGHPIDTGHAGGVVSVSMFQNGGVSGCMSDFAFGGGYGASNSGDDAYSINAHYWNDLNAQTNSWRAHAFYVR